MSGDPYRPGWWGTDRTLPQIAMDVVMTARGSFERLDDEQIDIATAALAAMKGA